MIYHYLIAVIGILSLMLGWIGVQSIVRKYHPDMKPGCDVLESMAHHCSDCDDMNCSTRKKHCTQR